MRKSLLSLLLLSAPAWAGLEIDRRIAAGEANDGQRMVLRESYDRQKQRVDILDGQGKKMTGRLSLFDEAKGEIYVFDEREKKYLVTPVKSLATPNRKIAKTTAPKFEKAGTKKVGAWNCTVYRVSRDGHPLGELCTVPPATFGLGASDVATFAHLSSMDWAQDANADAVAWTNDTAHGFPVDVVVSTGRGLPDQHVEVLAVRKVAFAGDHFALPKGYQRAESPGLPGAVVPPPRHPTPGRP